MSKSDLTAFSEELRKGLSNSISISSALHSLLNCEFKDIEVLRKLSDELIQNLECSEMALTTMDLLKSGGLNE